jgi:hypothetical protein
MAGTPPDYDNVRWPGADGLRVPQEMAPATLAITKEVDINIGTQGSSNVVNLNANQLRATYYYLTNASGAATINFPVVLPGVVFTVSNQSGQTVTLLVKGKTGVAVASTKHAILAMDTTAGDIVRVTADT